MASAFEVTVDDMRYVDMESFYTQELDRLPAKVRAAGYTDDYQVTFDAAIGLSDLWDGMQVFIAPTAERGHQGTTSVGSDGAFSLSIAEDDGAQYKIRANKRIRVTLTKPGSSINICYNFSAIDKSAVISRELGPVVLNHFVTTLTKYDCTKESPTGIYLPSVNPSQVPRDNRITKGMSRDEVTAILGDSGLVPTGENEMCWSQSRGVDVSICAVNRPSECPCSLTFDSNGYVSAQTNISSAYIDILSWN